MEEKCIISRFWVDDGWGWRWVWRTGRAHQPPCLHHKDNEASDCNCASSCHVHNHLHKGCNFLLFSYMFFHAVLFYSEGHSRILRELREECHHIWQKRDEFIVLNIYVIFQSYLLNLSLFLKYKLGMMYNLTQPGHWDSHFSCSQIPEI